MTIGVSFGDVEWAVAWVEVVRLEMGVHVGDAVALAVQETPPRAGVGMDWTRRLRKPWGTIGRGEAKKTEKGPRRAGKILESGKWVSRQVKVAKMSGKRPESGLGVSVDGVTAVRTVARTVWWREVKSEIWVKSRSGQILTNI